MAREGSNKAYVLEAIGVLGKKAKPKAISEWLKETHKVNLTPQQTSQIKSQSKKAGGATKGKRGRKPKDAVAVADNASFSDSLTTSLELMKFVTECEGKIGAKNVEIVLKQYLKG